MSKCVDEAIRPENYGSWSIHGGGYCGVRVDGPNGRSVLHVIQRDAHPTLGQGITQAESEAIAKRIVGLWNSEHTWGSEAMKRPTTIQADGATMWSNSNGVLTEAADNVLCARLASAAHTAINASAGDSIDLGLALLAEMKKQGFGVIYLGEPEH